MDGTVCSTMSRLLQTIWSIEVIGPFNKIIAGEAASRTDWAECSAESKVQCIKELEFCKYKKKHENMMTYNCKVEEGQLPPYHLSLTGPIMHPPGTYQICLSVCQNFCWLWLKGIKEVLLGLSNFYKPITSPRHISRSPYFWTRPFGGFYHLDTKCLGGTILEQHTSVLLF